MPDSLSTASALFIVVLLTKLFAILYQSAISKIFSGTTCADSAEGVCAKTANGFRFEALKRPSDVKSAGRNTAKVVEASAAPQTIKFSLANSLVGLQKRSHRQSAISIVPRDNLDWLRLYVYRAGPHRLRQIRLINATL